MEVAAARMAARWASAGLLRGDGPDPLLRGGGRWRRPRARARWARAGLLVQMGSSGPVRPGHAGLAWLSPEGWLPCCTSSRSVVAGVAAPVAAVPYFAMILTISVSDLAR